jgi:hypothetical protein
MTIKAALFLIIVCAACQSGRIPCPEIKFAKMKESKVQKGSRFITSPSKIMASSKGVKDQEGTKREVNLERLKSTRMTGKQMLEQYGTVEEWDCPSPSGKRKYSKVAKENVRKNEKKMREYLRQRSASDSISVIPPTDLHRP